MPDVFKILKDLELKTVGLDPKTNKMQEVYFVALRTVGLPIHGDDFSNPWTPTGGNLAKDIAKDPVDQRKSVGGQHVDAELLRLRRSRKRAFPDELGWGRDGYVPI